jgi:hypothetical protein
MNAPTHYPSLGAASAVGPGTVLDAGGCLSNHAMVVTSSAGVTAGAVQLQGSLDGSTWFNMGNPVSTTTANTTFTPIVVSDQPVRYLRANITTLITGGTVTAVVGMA